MSDTQATPYEPWRFGRGFAGADAYAEALLPLAHRAGALDDVLADLEQIGAMLQRERDIHAWFDSPVVPGSLKSQVVERTFRGRVSDLTCDALGVISRHERMGKLPAIVRAFRDQALKSCGQVEAHVTTAVPLNDKLRASIRTVLVRRLKADPVIVEHVDPKILGGLVVRTGDDVIDASVQNELEQIKRLIARWTDRMIAKPTVIPDEEVESE